MPLEMKYAGRGPYNLNIPVKTILESVGRVQGDDITNELQADLYALQPTELLAYLPFKKNGGLMQNRKVIIKKYLQTAYDPGYHDSKKRVWCLRIVPIDNWNAIVSFDDVTVDTDQLEERDIL